MCAPVVAWDWIVLDTAFILALTGGAMVLRARRASLLQWAWFGFLAFSVGAFCFSGTYFAQAAAPAVEEGASVMAACM